MNEPMFSQQHSGDGVSRRCFAIPDRQTPRRSMPARQAPREIATPERPATA